MPERQGDMSADMGLCGVGSLILSGKQEGRADFSLFLRSLGVWLVSDSKEKHGERSQREAASL